MDMNRLLTRWTWMMFYVNERVDCYSTAHDVFFQTSVLTESQPVLLKSLKKIYYLGACE